MNISLRFTVKSLRIFKLLNFPVFFHAKTRWTIQRWGNFWQSLYLAVQIWVLGVDDICLQFLIDILPLDPDPWFRIFLRIRIQKAKMLRIQQIHAEAIIVRIINLCRIFKFVVLLFRLFLCWNLISHSKNRKFLISLFLIVQIWVLSVIFFCSF